MTPLDLAIESSVRSLFAAEMRPFQRLAEDRRPTCATCGEAIIGQRFEMSHGSICLRCARAYMNENDR